jgi:uncharacterized membrane protein YhhN
MGLEMDEYGKVLYSRHWTMYYYQGLRQFLLSIIKLIFSDLGST